MGSASLRVAVLSLASRCEEKYLLRFSDILSSRFDIEVMDVSRGGCAAEKSRHLIECCMDPAIDCIWAMRGGYGSAECLPYLEKVHNQLRHMPETIIMGHSDITSLLLYFSQRLGQRVVHGPVVRDVLADKIGLDTLKKLSDFFKTQSLSACYELVPMNAQAQCARTVEAPLIGGNLCLVNLSVGDCNEIDTQNKVLVLEDVNEPPEAVIRGLSYLNRIGKIQLSCALVLGDFLSQAQSQDLMHKRLVEFAESLACPVFRLMHCGHGKENFPLPFYSVQELVVGGLGQPSYLKIKH